MVIPTKLGKDITRFMEIFYLEAEYDLVCHALDLLIFRLKFIQSRRYVAQSRWTCMMHANLCFVNPWDGGGGGEAARGIN